MTTDGAATARVSTGQGVGKRANVAVVGAGIAGMSAAYALRSQCNVTLFEAEGRAGGHANSIEVVEGENVFGLDTAFVVYNDPHYPKIAAFFAELGASTVAHQGGFSFFDKSEGWRYTSEDLEAAPGDSPMDDDVRLSTIKAEAKRFYEETPRHFIRGRCDVPLGEYLARENYSEEFKYGFIVLICSAAWSVPAKSVWQMSTSVVVAFFWGHGHGGLGGRSVEWRSVEGGSIQYVRRVVAALQDSGNEVRLNSPVQRVREVGDTVEVTTAAGTERFDAVIMGTHLDDSLRIVEDLAPSRRETLGLVQYGPTRVHLHTDASVMPKSRADWRSWNYGRRASDGGIDTWVVYYLNRLQGFEAQQDYFTTLDYPGALREDAIIATMNYRHPVISQDVRRRQDDLLAASTQGRVKFCGGYLHSRKVGVDILGIHEAAFDAGLQAAEAIQRDLSATHHRNDPATVPSD